MSRSNWLSYLLVIAMAVAVIILFFVLYSGNESMVILPVLILNIIFLFSGFCYFKLIYTDKMKKSIEIMKNSLESIITDPSSEKPRVVSDDKEVDYFYEEFDKLKLKLRKNDESRQEILTIINSVAINMEFDKLLEDLMPKLLDITNSTCCAFYMTNPSNNKLELRRSMGFSKNIYSEFDITIGEGFVGVAAAKQQTLIYNDIPDDSIYLIRTFLGKMKPKSMMVLPIVNQEQLAGVLVFASIYDYTAEQMSMVETIKYYMGIAVNNGVTYERTKRLTNELKFQNKLIQNLNEELEKNVQERTLFLNKIIDSIKDYAIYAMDRNGRILLWNKGAELLLGHKSEDVVGKPIEAIYSADGGEAGLVASRIESALQSGRYTENGWRYKKDGTKYYFEMILFAMHNEKGNIIGLTNITRDVTKSKKLESDLFVEREALKRLISNCSGAKLVINKDGYIQAASCNAKHLLEDEEGESPEGRDISEFFIDWENTYAELLNGRSAMVELRRVFKKTGESVNIAIEIVPGGELGEINKLLVNLNK